MNQELSVGGTLSNIFAIYRDHARVLLPVAAAIFVAEAVIAGLLVAAAPALVLVAVLVSIVATTLYTGMVVRLVEDVRDGRRDHTVAELFAAVRGVVGRLILAGLLVGILVAVGLVLFIVPGLFVLTIFAVVGPVIVLERRNVIEALGRSRELVRGDGLRVFGVILTVFLLAILVGGIASAIGAGAGTGGRIVGDLIGSTLTAPAAGLAAAVLYFELRGRKGEETGPEAPESPLVLP